MLVEGLAADAVRCLTSDERVIVDRRQIIGSVITAMFDLLARDTQLRHRYIKMVSIAISRNSVLYNKI